MGCSDDALGVLRLGEFAAHAFAVQPGFGKLPKRVGGKCKFALGNGHPTIALRPYGLRVEKSKLLERIDTKQPAAQREELRTLYHKLRRDRLAFEERKTTDEANACRHDEVLKKLEDLKRPHWSVVPNFWMTVAILLLTGIGVILTLLVLRH